jgi:ribosomal protein S18 acetylase RimI-like enzyme
MEAAAMDIRIDQVDGDELRRHAGGVSNLVRDAVDDGASIGFVLPLGDDVLAGYAEQVAADIDDGSRIVLLAFDDSGVVGMVQLGLVKWPNGRHRAELQKLIVHTIARRRGIGRELMDAVERVAVENGRTLLVLDTAGGGAEVLYRTSGWVEIGAVPGYAGLPDGTLVATTIFAKELV